MVLLNISLWKQNKLTLKGLSLGLVLVGKWIPLWRNPTVKGPPSTLRHCTRRGKVVSRCLHLKCLFLVDTEWLVVVIIVVKRSSNDLVLMMYNWFSPKHLHRFRGGNNFYFLKKNRQHLLYMRSYPKFLILQIDNICSGT